MQRYGEGLWSLPGPISATPWPQEVEHHHAPSSILQPQRTPHLLLQLEVVGEEGVLLELSLWGSPLRAMIAEPPDPHGAQEVVELEEP